MRKKSHMQRIGGLSWCLRQMDKEEVDQVTICSLLKNSSIRQSSSVKRRYINVRFNEQKETGV